MLINNVADKYLCEEVKLRSLRCKISHQLLQNSTRNAEVSEKDHAGSSATITNQSFHLDITTSINTVKLDFSHPSLHRKFILCILY